jgi:hypothetical protein
MPPFFLLAFTMNLNIFQKIRRDLFILKPAIKGKHFLNGINPKYVARYEDVGSKIHFCFKNRCEMDASVCLRKSKKSFNQVLKAGNKRVRFNLIMFL